MRKMQVVLFLGLFFVLNAIVGAQDGAGDRNVYDEQGQLIGFVDGDGHFHEFATERSAQMQSMQPVMAAGIQATASPAAVPVTNDESAWPMFQGNREHCGYLPISYEPNDFSLRWQKSIGVTSPVIAEDGLVVFTSGKTLYVLDAVDGETMWSKPLSGSYIGHPSHAYGNVYIQTCNHSSDTWLYAFDAKTGTQIFKSPTSAQWETYYSPTLYDGKAYINSGYYGGMYAFDAYTGQRLWFQSGLNQYDEWTPAVDANYAYAYIGDSCYGCYNAGLNILNRTTGAIVARINDHNYDWLGWSMNLAPVIGGMNDVFAIHDGRLLNFDLAARKIAYEIKSSFASQPVVAKGEVYTINGGNLDVRDEATGAPSWSWNPPEGSLTGTMALTDSHIFARTGTKTYAVDLYSRAATWSYAAVGSIAIANDNLYIGGSSIVAITAVERLPSKPVKLEIQGPEQVVENTTAQYEALVSYDDGRVRSRTIRTIWTVDCNDWASIDKRAVLSVSELIKPHEFVTIIADYNENGTALASRKQVELVTDCNVTELLNRNIGKVLGAKRQTLSLLDGANKIETANVGIIGEAKRGGRIGDLSRPSIDTLSSQSAHAILQEALAKRFIYISIDDLNSCLTILDSQPLSEKK